MNTFLCKNQQNSRWLDRNVTKIYKTRGDRSRLMLGAGNWGVGSVLLSLFWQFFYKNPDEFELPGLGLRLGLG